MNLLMFAGIFILVTTLVLMAVFATLNLQKRKENLRPIPSLDNLQKTINQAVEGGKGLHISLGRGGILGGQFGGSLMALSILKQIAKQSVNGDLPPLATTGDGLINILSHETLESAYPANRLPTDYGVIGSQVTGVTPFSYIAGAMMAHRPDDQTNLFIIGSYGAEAALLADQAERSRTHTISGTSDLTAQSMLFVTTRAPLIGEEFFAAGAYIQSAPEHYASAKTQDVLRILVVVAIIAGALLKLAGIL